MTLDECGAADGATSDVELMGLLRACALSPMSVGLHVGLRSTSHGVRDLTFEHEVVRPEGLEPPTDRVQSGGSGVVARGRAERETGVGEYPRTTPESPRLVYGLVYGASSGGVVGERAAVVG